MAQLKYQDRTVQTREGESVLDACLRQGVSLPFSCRSGVCHVCMQHCTDGSIPPAAQHGLSADLSAQGYFLPCLCVPDGPMSFEPPELYTSVLLHSKEMLTADVCRLLIEPPANLACLPGQFINLRRNGVVRSYSLANVPEEDYFFELHVQRKTGGVLSNWILDELQAGDEVEIQGPHGDCYYRDDMRAQPLLLIGTGTGLGPLLGIARDALRKQHQGEIHLYHGALAYESFYLRDTLRRLQQQHAQFHYHECILNDPAPQPGVQVGDVLQLACGRHPDLQAWQVYLAGAPEMVERGEQLALQCGAEQAAIHTDSFVLRELRAVPRDKKAAASDGSSPEAADGYPQPDPELWDALGRGERLMDVLKVFYGRVHEDARLASFFEGVTKQRSIEKQYLFMRQLITGEKIYFGDRPRNSHHWMVISDDLFDYRGEMMKTCLREHGLSEEMVRRFNAMEEYFRSDIVKDKPFPRVMGEIELPLDGFDELVMDVGSLCDSCEREVPVGEKVLYHVRLGKIYCADCSEQHHHEVPAS
ncbi:MAG TPA: FAD-binding oxidoreductase [Gallionellaceae bacterium]